MPCTPGMVWWRIGDDAKAFARYLQDHPNSTHADFTRATGVKVSPGELCRMRNYNVIKNTEKRSGVQLHRYIIGAEVPNLIKQDEMKEAGI